MEISEETKSKIIELFLTTNKSISKILKKVAPNGEITIEELYGIIEEYKEKHLSDFEKRRRNSSEGKILELIEKEFSTSEIAEKLGISQKTVLVRIKAMRDKGVDIPQKIQVEIPKKREIKKTENDEKDDIILELLDSGLSQADIARELGSSRANISFRVKKMKERGIDVLSNVKKRTRNKELNIAREIVNLIDTKNASVEQVRSMAKYYEETKKIKGTVEKVEELLKSLNEKER